MQTLDKLDTKKGLKLLLIGDSGAGKTVGAASFPGKTYVADFDKKISSAAKYLTQHNPEKLKDITYDAYLSGTLTPAEQFNQALGNFKSQSTFPYDNIVLDSLTTYSDEVMKYVIKENPGIKRMLTKGAQVPCQQDYQIVRIYFKQMIAALVALPCNVIVIAHIETDKDELTGQVVRSAMMAGKLKTELPIYFEECWRIYVDDKGQRWAQTQPDSRFGFCRTQLQNIPNPVKFTYEEVAKYL